jgi:ParB-like chromosome segregation protein Spo0J
MGPPKTLPANFNRWDQPHPTSAPKTLPADFQEWDEPAAAPKTPPTVSTVQPKPGRFAGFKELANRAIDSTLGAADTYVAQPVIRAGNALNESLADIPKAVTEPVVVPEGVTGTHEALYRANEGLRRAGRMGMDLLAPVMAPFSVAAAPLEPVVQPYSAAAGNILNATAGGNVRPELENPAESGLARISRVMSTPGAVQQENPNAQAINEFIGGVAPYLPFGMERKGPPTVTAAAATAREAGNLHMPREIAPREEIRTDVGEAPATLPADFQGFDEKPAEQAPTPAAPPDVAVEPGGQEKPQVAGPAAPPAAPPPTLPADFTGWDQAPPEGAKTITRQIELAPRDSITTRPDEMQPRKGAGKYGTNPDQVDALTTSMQQKGFDPSHPLKVWNDPASGETVLLEGHHRLAAAENAGIDEVPIERVSGTYEDAKAQARRSNSQMAPMGPMELAAAFDKEKKDGHTPAQIAQLYGGMKEHEVEDLLQLNQLEPSLQKEVQRGVFDVPRAVALAKAVAKHDIPPEIQRQAFDYVIAERDVTPAQLTKLLDTFAPTAVKQFGFDFGAQQGFEGMQGFMGLRTAMDEYLEKVRNLSRSQTRLKGFLKEAERMEREGTADDALRATRTRMEGEVKRLKTEIAKMEEDAGSGKLFRTLGQELEEGKARATTNEGEKREVGEPAVQPERRGQSREDIDRRIAMGVKLSQLQNELIKEVDPAKRTELERAIERERAFAKREAEPEVAAPVGQGGLFGRRAGGRKGGLESRPYRPEAEAEPETPRVAPIGERQNFRMSSGGAAAIEDRGAWKELFPDVTGAIGKAIDRITDKELTSADLEKGSTPRKAGRPGPEEGTALPGAAELRARLGPAQRTRQPRLHGGDREQRPLARIRRARRQGPRAGAATHRDAGPAPRPRSAC